MKKESRLTLLIFWALATTFSPFTAYGQDRPDLLVLGAVHFNNPGRDSINIEVDDMLSAQRQAEIEALVDELAEFEPTHIAVEVLSRNQDDLNERYARYREGDYELGRDESEQVGLRLAAKLGHDQVYAVDWNDNPPGDIETDYDWHSYGLANGFEADIGRITDPEAAKEYYIELGSQTVSTWIRQLNDPDALAASHRVYFDIAAIGRGEELLGANWVGTWYARNLKIFSRLVKLTESSTDRVLVIYGQGHAYLLRQFAQESGAFDLVDVDSVISD
ncbi:DUF5694 domain-containing protein [Pseudohongiella acticola]|jgi:Family of unknown function (DUF5694)|uniref:DUF5694 domain-containing protein n=1 Tax=Pseudohongiella acticola TaxID=1524254 RepID=UPI0030EE7660